MFMFFYLCVSCIYYFIHSRNIVDGLKQWFSKCGSYTSSIIITWKLIENADFQGLPQTYWIRGSGSGAEF